MSTSYSQRLRPGDQRKNDSSIQGQGGIRVLNVETGFDRNGRGAGSKDIAEPRGRRRRLSLRNAGHQTTRKARCVDWLVENPVSQREKTKESARS